MSLLLWHPVPKVEESEFGPWTAHYWAISHFYHEKTSVWPSIGPLLCDRWKSRIHASIYKRHSTAPVVKKGQCLHRAEGWLGTGIVQPQSWDQVSGNNRLRSNASIKPLQIAVLAWYQCPVPRQYQWATSSQVLTFFPLTISLLFGRYKWPFRCNPNPNLIFCRYLIFCKFNSLTGKATYTFQIEIPVTPNIFLNYFITLYFLYISLLIAVIATNRFLWRDFLKYIVL